MRANIKRKSKMHFPSFRTEFPKKCKNKIKLPRRSPHSEYMFSNEFERACYSSLHLFPQSRHSYMKMVLLNMGTVAISVLFLWVHSLVVGISGMYFSSFSFNDSIVWKGVFSSFMRVSRCCMSDLKIFILSGSSFSSTSTSNIASFLSFSSTRLLISVLSSSSYFFNSLRRGQILPIFFSNSSSNSFFANLYPRILFLFSV